MFRIKGLGSKIRAKGEGFLITKPLPSTYFYKMFYTYCLQHQITKELYYGYTDDLRRRAKEHKREDKN